mgnify:FL=1
MISLNPNVWGLGAMVTFSRAFNRWPAGIEADLQLGPLNVSINWTWKKEDSWRKNVSR